MEVSLVVRWQGPNHLFCMNRFFLHGGTRSPLLLKHLLTVSHVVEMVCFNSSAPLMNTSGTVASAFKNRCVGRAISNCAQKLRSMNLESKSRERERERERESIMETGEYKYHAESEERERYRRVKNFNFFMFSENLKFSQISILKYFIKMIAF